MKLVVRLRPTGTKLAPASSSDVTFSLNNQGSLYFVILLLVHISVSICKLPPRDGIHFCIPLEILSLVIDYSLLPWGPCDYPEPKDLSLYFLFIGFMV